MEGVPKHLNSHDDYVYVKDHFGEEVWKPLWLNMWNLRQHWMPTGVYESKEGLLEDETHRIIEQSDTMAGTQTDEEGNEIPKEVKYQQEEWKDDPHSDFFAYGFTEKEVKDALGL